jgi:hypothetical protein
MATPGPKRMNAEKLKAKIGSVVEQPPFSVGKGGLATTEPESHAQARAMLVFNSHSFLIPRA